LSQVGHADSKMTLDVYAQLQQRADRSHGTSFDALLRKASGQRRTLIGPRLGHEPSKREYTGPQESKKKRRKNNALRGNPEWRDPDSNRGHHDFQSCAEPDGLGRP
jgi:hypothetical protein